MLQPLMLGENHGMNGMNWMNGAECQIESLYYTHMAMYDVVRDLPFNVAKRGSSRLWGPGISNPTSLGES